jgi:hypothetical protein
MAKIKHTELSIRKLTDFFHLIIPPQKSKDFKPLYANLFTAGRAFLSHFLLDEIQGKGCFQFSRFRCLGVGHLSFGVEQGDIVLYLVGFFIQQHQVD